ncbi:MAG TPA: LytTR family DNA-binding domain-containing protein [Gemmatimonadaceae bacterium]|nr:LytTR family DNA-binding domain-containing protein [Gemmatimonadaceae bacterium]
MTVSVVAWSGIATLFLLQRLYALVHHGATPVWDRIATELTVTWGTWALLTPVIFLIVRRLPLHSENHGRLLLHVPIGVGVGLLHSLLVAVIMPLFLWRPSLLPMRDMFAGQLRSAVAFETLIYFMVAAALYAWTYAKQPARPDHVLPDSLTVPERDGLLRVPVASIEWLQAEDNYVRVYAGGRSHLLRTTLTSLEHRLPLNEFIRIHRSAVVSSSRIARLRRISSDHYEIILSNGVQLRVSRAYRKRVLEALQPPLTTQ